MGKISEIDALKAIDDARFGLDDPTAREKGVVVGVEEVRVRTYACCCG